MQIKNVFHPYQIMDQVTMAEDIKVMALAEVFKVLEEKAHSKTIEVEMECLMEEDTGTITSLDANFVINQDTQCFSAITYQIKDFMNQVLSLKSKVSTFLGMAKDFKL